MNCTKTLMAMGLLTAQAATAAVYYVSPNGSDSSPGTAAQPLRTIQKGADVAQAGDTVRVMPGDYEEYVTTRNSGTPGQPVIFLAEGSVTTRAFRVNNHEHVVLDGFRLLGAQNLWLAHVRVESRSHNTTVRNCTFGPGVFAVSDSLRFDESNQSLTGSNIDWLAAGFVPGGLVYTGGSGLEQYWYANHDKAWSISRINGNTMFLEGNWLLETNSAAWAPVFAGANSAGIEGVMLTVAGGNGPTNCVIVGNTFTNLFGPAITLHGLRHTVAHNTFTKLNSYYGLRPNGGEHLIYSNLWYNCSNFIHYSSTEFSTIPHPPGTGWYDYQVGFIHATGSLNQGASNVWFFRNWIEGCDNQLGQINELAGAYGFNVTSNVFVGVFGSLSGGRNGLRFSHNTFYRVNFDAGAAALTIGGNRQQTPATNLWVGHNVFVDVGNRRNVATEGYYLISNVVDEAGGTYGVADHNFVAGPETTGWSDKRGFSEPHGINGGDPMFVDPLNPRGPDGLPFTADDGLRPLPQSPVALLSLGALEPVTVVPGEPIAYFTIIDISSGLRWYDKAGLDFDPSWMLLPPFKRPGKVRPYTTPEAVGEAPVTVTFDASGSWSGSTPESGSWTGITRCEWRINNYELITTQGPTLEYTFENGGEHLVHLTVHTGAGTKASTQRRYRVLGPPARDLRLRIMSDPLRLGFTAYPGIVYTVERSSALPADNWILMSKIPSSDVETVIEVDILAGAANAAEFYRVNAAE
jgi:hypothetical protein